MAQDTEPSGPAVDEEPSSPTLSSPTPVASASASSQPTYTTAGTIYNPSSSQRLQPPARRGRLLKLNSEASGFPLDAAKFGTPRSMLSDAQFRSDASTKVPAATAIQQYSPLQQNYDRAVSPVVSPTHEPGMSFHGVRPHNASLHAGADSPHVSLFDNGKGKAVATNNGSSSDDDDDIVNSALMNMTVKSLQNLASYPNPNQKSAQKALLRGTRPKAGSNLSGGPSRLSTPFTYRNASPGRATNPRVKTPQSDSDLFCRNPALFTREPKTVDGDLERWHPKLEQVRQYRPSTFESTFKALATRSVASQGFFNEAEEDRPSFAVRVANTVPSTPQDSVAEDEEYMSAPELSMNTYNSMPAVARSPPLRRLTVREIQEHNWRLNVMWYAGTGLLGDFDAAQVLSQPTSHNTNPPVAKHIYGAVGEGRPNQAVKESPAAREDGPCSMPIRFVDDDVTDGLALLDQVLSRAT
ncbi:hypothetical protein TrVFT333_001737 [Trichoderma virens FT-333]|nr:hypothetical protein TrVFT333_001737 [Trichoderma virens FT-333]